MKEMPGIECTYVNWKWKMEHMKEIVLLIYSDFQKYILAFAGQAVSIGVILSAVQLIYDRRKAEDSKSHFGKYFWTFIMGVYFAFLLYITFGIRYIGQRREVNLIPFSSFNIYSSEIRFVIENIILFIPFGIILPVKWKRFKKFQFWISGS